jgi:hypothetical protein
MRRWVAKECRRVWQVAGLTILAFCTASRKTLWIPLS